MDFETIFTILFILIIVLFQVIGSVLKKPGEAETGPGTDKPTGLGQRLKEMVEHIRKEMAAAGQAATIPTSESGDNDKRTGARPGGWEVIRPEQPGRAPAGEPKTRRPLPERERPAEPDLRSDAADAYRQLTVKKPGAERMAAERGGNRGKPTPAIGTPIATPSPRSHRYVEHERILELRRAVIWAEILAPPLALRQDRD